MICTSTLPRRFWFFLHSQFCKFTPAVNKIIKLASRRKCSSLRWRGHAVSAWPDSNGPMRVKDETRFFSWFNGRVYQSTTRLLEKPNYRTLLKISRSCFVFRPPKHMYVEWNLLGFMELLLFWRFRTFLCEDRAICVVTSGQEAPKCAAFNSFLKGATLFQIYPPNGHKMA